MKVLLEEQISSLYIIQQENISVSYSRRFNFDFNLKTSINAFVLETIVFKICTMHVYKLWHNDFMPIKPGILFCLEEYSLEF